MKKKYAFMLMGGEYDPNIHRTVFDSDNIATIIQGVGNFSEAKDMALTLQREGVGALELCGAFTQEMAAELAKLTGGTMAIAYMTHDPALDGVFAAFWEKP